MKNGFNKNFGKGFGKNGGFGAGATKKLGNAGVDDVEGFSTWLKNNGLNPNKRNINDQIMRFNNQVPEAPGIEDSVDTSAVEQASAAQTQAGQAAAGGANNQFSNSLANNANQAAANSQGLLNGVQMSRQYANNQAGMAQDPRLGRGMRNTLNQQLNRNLNNNEILFGSGSQAMSDFNNRLQQGRANEFATGLVGSKSAASREGKVFSDLQRARAEADIGAFNNFDANTLNQLDNQRQTNMGLAGLFDGRAAGDINAAQGFANTSVGANSAAGQTDLGNRQLGADMMNQGINNQQRNNAFGADLMQRDFDNATNSFTLGEQVRQQDLENKIGRNSRRFDRQMIQDMMNMGSGGRGFGEKLMNTFMPFTNWF